VLFEYTLTTPRQDFYNITPQIKQAIMKSCLSNALAVVFCPHTTASITINENADPDVIKDLLLGLEQAFPNRPEFRHSEGNSQAHLKSSCLGSSVTLIVESGRLLLGTWQGVYFCEFDPPRNRKFFVKIIGV
jgi:secondary thiamine-phosphate synthase enzyme